jgi:hypothetical protein
VRPDPERRLPPDPDPVVPPDADVPDGRLLPGADAMLGRLGVDTGAAVDLADAATGVRGAAAATGAAAGAMPQTLQ